MELSILLFSIAGNLILGLLVYLKNPHNSTNKLLAALTVSLLMLVVANHFSVSTQSSENASTILFWIRMTMFSAAPVGLLYLLFVHTFPEATIKLSKVKILLFSSLSALTMIVALSPYLFTELKVSPDSVQPTPGPGIILFVIAPVGLIIYAIVLLIKKMNASTGLQKEHLKLILIGTSLMFSLIIGTVFIPVNIFNFTLFVPLTPLYTLAFVSITAYAVIRHRLMDIRLVVARAAAYALLASLLFVLYVSATTVGASVFTKTSASISQLVLFGVVTLIIGYSFNPLRNLLERFTDRIFYRGQYDSSELLSDLTKIMATTLGLTPLMSRLLVKILPEMRVSKGVFVLIKDGKIEEIKATGFGKVFQPVATEINSLVEENRLLIYEEITKKHIKKLMQELDITVSVPLKVKEEELGLLLLGHKLSGEIYTNQDVKLLEILSPEISIAIQNAKAYEEIRRFNVTLQEEVKKATSDLRSANSKLKELDRLKDEFMSIASHELRTPMTAIKSYVWLTLHGKTAEKDPKVKEYLEKVYASSERMISMINDMLNVSRIETGRLQLEIAPVAAYKVAESVRDDLTAKANEVGVSVVINKDNTVPNVLADKDKLAEIFTNLIGNSLKFTKSGGRITVSAQRKGGLVEISVSDTGVGISKQNLSKLFKKYGKLNESYATVSPSTGTGLGLYITKQYLEKMDGSIKIDSVLGKGTTFTFSLPIATGKEIADDDQETQPVGIVFNPKFLEKMRSTAKTGLANTPNKK